MKSLRPFIIESIERQMVIGYDNTLAICIGKGKNLDFLNELNEERKWFDSVVGVVHPRWVMQYNRKDKQKYIDLYLSHAL